MPIIDLEPAPLGSVINRPERGFVTPGEEEATDRPSMSSVLGATYRRENILASASAAANGVPDEDDPDFAPFDHIRGTKYEANWDSFVDVRNRAQFDETARKIDREREDRKIIDAAPWYMSVPASLLANVTDPTILVPGGAFVKGARGGFSLARSALSVGAGAGIGTAVQEVGLQATQETRTAAESAFDIGASTLLGGLIGTGGAALLSRPQWNSAVRALDDQLATSDLGSLPPPAADFVRFYHGGLNPTTGGGRWVTTDPEYARKFRAGGGENELHYVDIPRGDPTEVAARAWDDIDEAAGTNMVGRYNHIELPEEWAKRLQPFKAAAGSSQPLVSLGAAAVSVPALADTAVAGRVAGVVAAGSQKINPGLRLAHSEVPESRDVAGNLSEMTHYIKGNEDGLASPVAAETLRKEWNAGLMQAVVDTWKAYVEYRKRTGGYGFLQRIADLGPNSQRTSFNREVGRAMRNGDQHAIPEVAKVAQAWRKNVFDPLKEAAIAAKLLPEDVSVDTAISYFSRLWNRKRLIAEEGEFKRVVRNWISGRIDTWEAAFDAETRAGAAKLGDVQSAPRLVVARLMPDGSIRYGKPGQVHSDLMTKKELSADGPTPEAIERSMGFAEPGGKFLSRAEALEFAKKHEPARSAHSAERSDLGLEAATYNEGSKAREKLEEYLTKREAERDERFGDPTGSANDVADEVFNTLTGRTSEGVRPEFITIKARGPLKERTFNIPDELVERWLESDVELVGRRYQRIMSADVELANKFGSPDMTEAIDKVRQGYNKLRAGVTDEKRLSALNDAEKNDIRDIEGMRDIIRGTYADNAWQGGFGSFVRQANAVQYILKMGQVVLSSLTEPVRVVAAQGMLPFMRDAFGAISNINAIKLSIQEARLAGNILDKILAARLSTLADLTDFYGTRNPVDKFLDNLTNVASSWNGIRLWTDGVKMLASTMIQNKILRGVVDFANADKRYLNFLGIDESMAGRIAKQFAEHGEVIDGVHVAGTAKWTDEVARRYYRAALNKDLDSMVVTRGAGDLPLFANTPLGRLIFQFNTFNLASHQRVLLRGLQESHARFLSGAAALTSMGMLQTYLVALATNSVDKLPDREQNPGWWIAEGLDRSGLFSVPFQIANGVEKLTGMNPIKAPIKQFDAGQTLSQKNRNRNELGVLGPSAGTIHDIGTVAGIAKTMAAGEEITKAQKNAGERLLPFNSYVGVRQLMKYFVNPPNE